MLQLNINPKNPEIQANSLTKGTPNELLTNQPGYKNKSMNMKFLNTNPAINNGSQQITAVEMSTPTNINFGG
jgi:hypothetical protein